VKAPPSIRDPIPNPLATRESTDALLASIGDPFYLLDREWRFTYVNDAAQPLLQATRDELLGRTLWEAFPGVIGSEFEVPYRTAMAEGRVTSAEGYFAPLGTWFDVHTYPWVGGLMVHFRDVGARKEAEAERERLLRALELERARLQEVFRRAPSFIVAFRGPDQVYEFVNDAYYQLVGHREIIGRPLLEAIPEIREQGFKEILDAVLATGEPWVGRESAVELQRTPGAPLETRYLDMVFQALAEADGTYSGVVVHGSDITAQVLARREVERLLLVSEEERRTAEAARREADAANRAKSEFLAVMSHELRTPLNAIGGYSELLSMELRGPLTEAQREDLRRIDASQRHLLGLINEVLNYARLETGTVHYELEDVPVRHALATAEALVSPQARAKGLQVVVNAGDGDLVVRADAEKLRQVLVNLLSNAVKFTDAREGRAGRIELSCDARDGTVAVRVRDTGIGIPADKLGVIFDPFVQVRADLTRTAEGTGLGLAISRDLARGMGGDLVAESEEGVGSTFILTLPAA
jgi:signal transduction histidine kinase